MKKLILIILAGTLTQLLYSQSIVYHRLDNLIENTGDTIESPRFLTAEKRNTAQILLQNGGDYKVSSNRSWLRKSLRNKYFAAMVDNNLYINCRKLRIKKFRFGKFYAQAMMVGGEVYFSAIPVGPAAAAVVDRNIGMGAVGGAIASSSAVNQRVFYQIDSKTGEVSFVGKEKMFSLLNDYPELKEAYLQENNQEASVTQKYLLQLKKYSD